MKRKVKPVSSKQGDQSFNVSIEQKKKIIGLLLITLSVLIFLSIISYTQADNDQLSSIFSDMASPPPVNNWISIIGAHIANLFVNGTFGYFSVVFPLMMLYIGIYFFHKFDLKKLLISFNFLLTGTLVLASFFGVLKAQDNFPQIMHFSGAIGDSVGAFLQQRLKGIGSLLILSVSFIVILILAFDLKIENIFHFFVKVKDKISESGNGVSGEEVSDNLKKVPKKKLKLKPDTSVPVIDESDDEEYEDTKEEPIETKIRIKLNKDQIEREAKAKKDKESKKIAPAALEDLPIMSDEAIAENGEPKEEDEDYEERRIEKLPEPWEENINYQPLSFDLLEKQEEEDVKIAEEELTKNANLLKEKLKLFNIDITDIDVTPGPVVTLYEIVPAPGVKISQIVSLENDIALALAARGIRIIAPIPGKSAIGVEIPNAHATIVRASSVMPKVRNSKMELPIALGKQINGEVYLADLATMPHLLIAGSTGSGKSVGINMIINSLLFAKHPSDLKFMMIDPKKIELSFYKKIKRHYLATCSDIDEDIITIPQNAVILLKSVEIEMERRYDKFVKAGVRNIIEYNQKVADPVRKPKDTDVMKHFKMPYLVVIVDELADLMMTSGKEVEEPITRLAQLARAVGIHLVIATQRPSVNVITGVIKANFSSRIAYQVASKIDSRTILDMNGADQLLGKGDMLFLPTGQPKPIRIQNAYLSTDEVEKITEEIKHQPGYSKSYPLPSIYEAKKEKGTGFIADLDPMFEEAARVIVRNQKGSVSLLQRRLKLGYSRAARIVDQLEEAGIVGPNNGSAARDVIIENEEQLEVILRSL